MEQEILTAKKKIGSHGEPGSVTSRKDMAYKRI